MRILWIDARHDNDKGLVRPTPVALGKVLFLIQWCAKIVSKKHQKVSKKCSKKCQKRVSKRASKRAFKIASKTASNKTSNEASQKLFKNEKM